MGDLQNLVKIMIFNENDEMPGNPKLQKIIQKSVFAMPYTV